MTRITLLLMGCSLCFPAGAEEALSGARIRHDPFQRPAIAQQSSGQPGNGNPSAPQPAAWRPRLIATMEAGSRSMANVDGQILKIGETLKGYTLIQVKAGMAVFEKHKKHFKLKIDDQANE